MSGLFRKLGFSLVPVFVIGAAAELGLRQSGWPQVTETFEHNSPFWVTDESLAQKAFPHKEEKALFRVSSNADGLRTATAEREKKEGIYRVMALGCSTTFGWGVDDKDTYPAKLQSLITASDRINVEVINAGQPGYTSFQGRWLWDEVLKHYTPDVVLIGYVVQDARKAAYSDKSQAILQKDNRFLKDHVLYNSRTYLALRSILGTVQVEAKERPQNGQGGIYRVPPEDYVDNIRTLVSQVQAVGATPVLFGFPLEREGYTETHRTILAAAAKELEIPYLELQGKMEQASRQSQLYFSNDRGHANAAGNAQIAEWVFDFLVEQSLLKRSE
jgi:lysophospholipase L1-like esterase